MSVNLLVKVRCDTPGCGAHLTVEARLAQPIRGWAFGTPEIEVVDPLASGWHNTSSCLHPIKCPTCVRETK